VSERKLVDIKVLWTNLYKSVRTFLLSFVRPSESVLSYRLVEALVRRRGLIDEIEDDKYHLLLKINIKGSRTVDINDVAYSLIPLSLTHLPKTIVQRGEYSLGTFLFEGFSKPKLVAASITLSKDSEKAVRYLRPILISVSPDVSDPLIKKHSGKVSSMLFREVITCFSKYAPRYVPIINSIHLLRPLAVVVIRNGNKSYDEIKAVVSDGSEYREVRIPIKVPSWSLEDLPPKIVEDVRMMIINPIIKKYDFAPKGAFITGPPGVGKSVMAEALAAALNLKMIELRPSTYRSMWYGATEKTLNAIFSQIIKKRSEVALVLDDAEFISSRKYTIHEAHISEISTILYHLQRPDRPFTILTANNPDLIDPALLRPGRIDVSIVLGYPDRVMRRKIIERDVNRYGVKISDEVIETIVKATKWFSAAEVNAFIRLAASRGDGSIGLDEVEWAKRRMMVNVSERKSMQEFLRWWVSKTQGMVITYIPSDNDIE